MGNAYCFFPAQQPGRVAFHPVRVAFPLSPPHLQSYNLGEDGLDLSYSLGQMTQILSSRLVQGWTRDPDAGKVSEGHSFI